MLYLSGISGLYSLVPFPKLKHKCVHKVSLMSRVIWSPFASCLNITEHNVLIWVNCFIILFALVHTTTANDTTVSLCCI